MKIFIILLEIENNEIFLLLKAANIRAFHLENAIEALKSGQEVAVKETKALGCGIKWKRAE